MGVGDKHGEIEGLTVALGLRVVVLLLVCPLRSEEEGEEVKEGELLLLPHCVVLSVTETLAVGKVDVEVLGVEDTVEIELQVPCPSPPPPASLLLESVGVMEMEGELEREGVGEEPVEEEVKREEEGKEVGVVEEDREVVAVPTLEALETGDVEGVDNVVGVGRFGVKVPYCVKEPDTVILMVPLPVPPPAPPAPTPTIVLVTEPLVEAERHKVGEEERVLANECVFCAVGVGAALRLEATGERVRRGERDPKSTAALFEGCAPVKVGNVVEEGEREEVGEGVPAPPPREGESGPLPVPQ